MKPDVNISQRITCKERKIGERTNFLNPASTSEDKGSQIGSLTIHNQTSSLVTHTVEIVWECTCHSRSISLLIFGMLGTIKAYLPSCRSRNERKPTRGFQTSCAQPSLVCPESGDCVVMSCFFLYLRRLVDLAPSPRWLWCRTPAHAPFIPPSLLQPLPHRHLEITL